MPAEAFALTRTPFLQAQPEASNNVSVTLNFEEPCLSLTRDRKENDREGGV
jgi:hypothetical protein